MRGIRRELARLYVDARTDVVAPAMAAKLAYVLTCLQKVVELEKVESRLDAIEQQMKAKEQKRG